MWHRQNLLEDLLDQGPSHLDAKRWKDTTNDWQQH